MISLYLILVLDLSRTHWEELLICALKMFMIIHKHCLMHDVIFDIYFLRHLLFDTNHFMHLFLNNYPTIFRWE